MHLCRCSEAEGWHGSCGASPPPSLLCVSFILLQKQLIKIAYGLGCSSVVEHVLSIYEAWRPPLKHREHQTVIYVGNEKIFPSVRDHALTDSQTEESGFLDI